MTEPTRSDPLTPSAGASTVGPRKEAHPSDDVLTRLVRLVEVRARAVHAGGGGALADLEDLREVLAALDHHLRALELLSRVGDGSGSPSADAQPDRPEAASEPRLDTPEPAAGDAREREQPVAHEPHTAEPDPSPHDTPAAAPPPPETPVTGSDEPSDPEEPPARGHAQEQEHAREQEHAQEGGQELELAARDFPPFRDQVTGLHSREGFDAVAGGELKRCRRFGRVFSLLLLQLPNADDGALRRVAKAIRTATREFDLAGRHVDRTFAVALPETAPTQLRIVAQRIIEHLEGVGAWDAESRLGLATHPAHGETLIHLIEAARAQLTLPADQVLAFPERQAWPG